MLHNYIHNHIYNHIHNHIHNHIRNHVHNHIHNHIHDHIHNHIHNNHNPDSYLFPDWFTQKPGSQSECRDVTENFTGRTFRNYNIDETNS